jgi:hypothetical protein
VAIALVTGLLIGACVTYVLTVPRVTPTTTTTVNHTLTTTATTSTTSTIVSTTTTIGDKSMASTTNLTLGLEITLTLNATRITSGQTVNATLTYRNVLDRTLNLSASSEEWRSTALADDGDDYGYCVGVSPFAEEVYLGHLTASNVSVGAPANFDFSDILGGCGLAIGGYNVFPPLTDGRGWTDTTSGYSVNGHFTTFPTSGEFTVVAGDRWGQIVMLSFTVGQAA